MKKDLLVEYAKSIGKNTSQLTASDICKAYGNVEKKKYTAIKTYNKEVKAMKMELDKKGIKLDLSIEIDPKGRDSSTGKSTVHFTSSGYTAIPNSEYKISITIIKSKNKSK